MAFASATILSSVLEPPTLNISTTIPERPEASPDLVVTLLLRHFPRLRHMKNKSVRQSHASSRNSEATDV